VYALNVCVLENLAGDSGGYLLSHPSQWRAAFRSIQVVDVFNPDPRATTPRMTVMVHSLTGKTWAFEAQMKKDAPGFFFSEWSPLGYWMSPPYDVDDEQVTPFTERK